ncbi:MAG: hypothetical protein IJ744_03100 [Lachnospiraceae bacterium]|nr:hypothetical protein [Lachnospiraceae bacterium]
MRRFKTIIARVLVMLMIFASGCGLFVRAPKELTADGATMNTVLIKEDGTIDGILMEDFGESYAVDDLKGYVEAAVASYNQEKGSEGITLKEVTEAEGKAVVVLSYATAEDFTAFNEVELKTGVGNQLLSYAPTTILSAKMEESDAQVAFTDQYQGVVLGIPAEGENAYQVIVNQKVAYFAGGELTNKFTVTGDGSEPVIVLFKKK